MTVAVRKKDIPMMIGGVEMVKESAKKIAVTCPAWCLLPGRNIRHFRAETIGAGMTVIVNHK